MHVNTCLLASHHQREDSCRTVWDTVSHHCPTPWNHKNTLLECLCVSNQILRADFWVGCERLCLIKYWFAPGALCSSFFCSVVLCFLLLLFFFFITALSSSTTPPSTREPITADSCSQNTASQSDGMGEVTKWAGIVSCIMN